MATLDFQEIARLLNYSRTTQINLSATKGTPGRWAQHQGWHKVHTSSYPFTVLYLHAAATLEDARAAARELRPDTESHVVYPPSLGMMRRNPEIVKLFKKAKGNWTTKEYLVSFIKDELQTYLIKLADQAPKFYIDPLVDNSAGFPHKTPNPLLLFLSDPDSLSATVAGKLAIVLAEPGQGKTYMSRHLVSRLAAGKGGALPLMVDSSQWHTLSLDDQSSLSKTITHSFRYFDANIGWLEGHEEEFLQATLKADIFRIVFDGFDEYILQNRGSVQPLEVLDALANLANSTGARIVITSRTSFWHSNLPDDQRIDFLSRTGSFEYTIQPFNLQQATNYFSSRLTNERQKQFAVRTYGDLNSRSGALVGRGFVLSLIADLAERTLATTQPATPLRDGLLWLVDSLCERELLRQQLPFSAEEQVEIFRTFAVEVATGEAPNTELLRLAMSEAKPSLDLKSLDAAVLKLKSHPLIERKVSLDVWSFKQEQIRIVLLADQILRWSPSKLSDFVRRVRIDASSRQDVASAIVELLRSRSDEQTALSEIGTLCRDLSLTNMQLTAVDEGRTLAVLVALAAVEEFRPKGSSHEDRWALLTQILGGSVVRHLNFTGTVARYDMRGVHFEFCRFDNVTWANCRFDEETTFLECAFSGGTPPAHCDGLGSAKVKDCRLDAEADAMFNRERVKDGRRRYSSDDLQSDIKSVVSKFISKGGVGLKAVGEANLKKGPISASRYRDEILEVLGAIALDQHTIPGGYGYNIRENALEAFKFFAANNVLTGPLRDAFDKLSVRLRLIE
jgi:NACHT domain